VKLNHRFLLLFVLLFISSILFSQGYKDTLTNKSIIELRKNNLGVDIIKMKITKSVCAFDLSVDGLIQLKKNGISDEIITSMLSYQTGDENFAKNIISNEGNRFANSQTSSNSRNDSKSSEKKNFKSTKPGIYYCIGSAPELVQLETSVFSNTKSGSGLATAYTKGIAKTKQKSLLNGSSSSFQIEEKSPVFRFYFGEGRDDFATSANFSWFSSASNPNEFLLLRFDVKNGIREIVTGSYNLYSGSSTGVDNSNRIAFKFQKIDEGVYKIFFDNPLPKGEYCFMYAGGTNASTAILNKVYDFSIK